MLEISGIWPFAANALPFVSLILLQLRRDRLNCEPLVTWLASWLYWWLLSCLTLRAGYSLPWNWEEFAWKLENSFCCVAVLTLFSRTSDFEPFLFVDLEGTTCLFLIVLLPYCFVTTLLLYILQCYKDLIVDYKQKFLSIQCAFFAFLSAICYFTRQLF